MNDVITPQTTEDTRMTNSALPLVVAISSRALFDLDESHQVFEGEGMDAYASYQIARETELLQPGPAFVLVQKLLGLNRKASSDTPAIEVLLLSRNSADTGLRIFNSIEHYGLDISRAAFTNGEPPHRYMASFGAHLFLSTHAEDVRRTLAAGAAAATILAPHSPRDDDAQLRIAFDGDSVLFSDEAERVYQEQGLDAFSQSERQAAHRPLAHGPFAPVLKGINAIQAAFPSDQNPIRTALVTARSAPAHKRVILTLRHWGVRIDEALFLGGRSKGSFLKAFGADIFFDDQAVHCESAREHVTAGHVPSGVTNQ